MTRIATVSTCSSAESRNIGIQLWFVDYGQHVLQLRSHFPAELGFLSQRTEVHALFGRLLGGSFPNQRSYYSNRHDTIRFIFIFLP